jgi:hypothetical protein
MVTGLELSDVGVPCTNLSAELHLASPNCFGGIQLTELGKLSLTAPLVPVGISYEPTNSPESCVTRLSN